MLTETNEYLDARALQGLVDAVKKLPPPPHHENTLLTHYKCMCGKSHPIASAQIMDTGVVQAIKPTCPDCASDFSQLCPVVCVRCKEVAVYMPPHKDKSGFVFERGKSYHIEQCPKCNPESTTSQIIEIHIYNERTKK